MDCPSPRPNIDSILNVDGDLTMRFLLRKLELRLKAVCGTAGVTPVRLVLSATWKNTTKPVDWDGECFVLHLNNLTKGKRSRSSGRF